MAQALLVVDVQNDYFPDGQMPLVAMDRAATQAARLLYFFRTQSWPIFHIQHIAKRPGATFFLPGTKGCAIHESVCPEANEPVIIKHYPNSFRETDLQSKLLRFGIKQLVIVGAMTHMCIAATTRAAFDLHYACTVISDACATRNLCYDENEISAEEVQVSFLGALQNFYAHVISTQHYLNFYAETCVLK